MWIAFKKLYLWYSEQLRTCRKRWRMSCELLSKNCIFDILNNNTFWMCKALEVVNCFQKIVSLIFWTTFKFNNPDQVWLWIAFKKLYLWYSEQQTQSSAKQSNCCELLSKNCIFDILNNNLKICLNTYWVVNCFQKIVSLIFWTTGKDVHVRTLRCELLSKNCIFDILNNVSGIRVSSRLVVNCFQKIVSLIFWTTDDVARENGFSCELLSKNCIFDILNNTEEHLQEHELLWIAFKKLYLWYSEQLV